jgi:hypothetical protein
MTPKSDAAAAERKVMDRYAKRLQDAYDDAQGEGGWGGDEGEATLAILRASAAALFPGDQQRKHLLPALGKMVTAACRVIRRSAR